MYGFGLALLQNDNGAGVLGALFGSAMMLVWLAVMVVVIAGGWKVFTKAGQPGWAIIVPLFNIYILLKIVGRPAWWLVLYLIPVVNFVIALIVAIDLAKSFGQSAAFGVVMLFLLAAIGFLILGFGSAKYVGPATVSPQARAMGA